MITGRTPWKCRCAGRMNFGKAYSMIIIHFYTKVELAFYYMSSNGLGFFIQLRKGGPYLYRESSFVPLVVGNPSIHSQVSF